MRASIKSEIFREYDIRGIVGEQLNPKIVRRIGQTLGIFFSSNKAEKIAVGRDARKSSPKFLEIICEELIASGCTVVDIGMIPTPVLNHALFTEDFDGGVMITGSHNPPNHNGFKISLGRHTLHGAEIKSLENIALSSELKFGEGKIVHQNPLKEYTESVLSQIVLGSRKLRVVIDAGNGVGGITAIPILKSLGVEVFELYCNPDSSFPNHPPDPSATENLADLRDAVISNNADFGVAFDGDADRLAVIDNEGKTIWGDVLTAIFAREILKTNPGATVIGEVKCSKILFDEIVSSGGKAIMSKAGHSIIKSRIKELGAILAGEMSGHIFFADKYFGFDDACYASVRLCELLSNSRDSLAEIAASFPKTYSSDEIRIECPEAAKKEVVARIAEKYAANHIVDMTDGARIDFGFGWALVRPSNTQALVILRYEAESKETLKTISHAIEGDVIKAIDQLAHSSS